jgi:hypothetical protein
LTHAYANPQHEWARDERGAPEPFNFGSQPPIREAAE